MIVDDPDRKSPEELWEEFWWPLLSVDGEIVMDRVAAELSDYHDLMSRHVDFLCEVTGSTLSYPNYPLETMLEVHAERCPEARFLAMDIEEALDGDEGIEAVRELIETKLALWRE